MAAMLTSNIGFAGPAQEVKLRDYLNHTWSDELISYPLDKGLAGAKAVQAKDEAGTAVPTQISDGRVYLLLTLPANAEKKITIEPADSPVLPPKPAAIRAEADALILDSGTVSFKLPAGEKKYDPPADPANVPGPLLGVRLGGAGAWIGKSWLETPVKVKSFKTTVGPNGPLFAEATVDYTFEGDRHYTFNVRVVAGQNAAVISEHMDVNPGDRYVLLKYSNDADASSWEWWNLADSEHMLPGQGRNEQPANAVFSFYSGLEPNQCRWTAGRPTHPRKGVDADGKPTVMQESGELYAPLTYEDDERFNRLTGWWLNSFSDRSYSFTFFNDAKPAAPAVSLLMGRPSRNVNPHMNPPPEPWIKILTGLNDMRIWTLKEKDLRVFAPICLGSREWLLMLEPQSDLRPKGDKQVSNAFRRVLSHSWYPLEKVKDWTFDWPEPANAWPRLFCNAGDMDEMKKRVAAATGEMAKSQLIPAIYKTGGTPDAMAKQALERLEGAVKGALWADGHGSINWFHASLHMMQAMPLWEAAMATPGIDPAVRAKIKAYGAFVAHRAWDDDYWPPKETANGWGSANMGTLAAGARVLCAAAMAGHPDQQRWLKRCRGYLDGNMIGLMGEDGSGLSCPHYLGASTDPVLYMALALKYGGNYNCFKEDPRWPKFCQFMIDILTPPDPRSPLIGGQYGLPFGAKLDPGVKNRRNIWPLGHTSRTETTGILDMLALGMQGQDEKLAGALRYMSSEMGATSSGAFVAYALISNSTSQPVPPELKSRWYPQYGAILRDGRPAEDWFAIRYSKFAFDHFQSDMGAFTLFAKGVPLMMDFGSMYSPENGQPVYHNRVSWDVQEGTPKPCPGNQKDGCFYKGLTFFEHTVEPWTCKAEAFGEGQAPTDAFGEITAFSSTAGADFLLGKTDVKTLQTLPYFETTSAASAPDPNQKRILEKIAPFAWERRVLFAKPQNEIDPLFILVRDDFSAPCPPPMISYWVMATDLKFDGARAVATGQFGVDLDLYCAQPASPQFAQWQWEHKNWGGEKQLCVRIPQNEGKPVLVALCPRKAGETPPAFAAIAGGNGVKIAGPQPDTANFAFLAPSKVEFTEGDVRFSGTAGAVRSAPTGATLVLSAPGSASAPGISLESTGSASLTLQGGAAAISTYGGVQTLKVAGAKLPASPQIQLDGKKHEGKKIESGWEFEVPEGEHTLMLIRR